MVRKIGLQTTSFTLVIGFLLGSGWQLRADDLEFNQDIRPILSDYCFQCHGPDKNKREANLRLDLEDVAKADRDGSRAIVENNAAKSELYSRITSDDDDVRMPPPSTGRKLSARQKQMLRDWIDHGANWQQHWALIAPQRSTLPHVSDTTWPRNAIDYFVLANLDRNQLKPSNTADKRTLIRRVTLDLIGLPPTPGEVKGFLADNSPGAYERVVDRLLQSPRYGERMTVRWLNAARYADTSGYQNDGPRYMWRWRDWVIQAYNANMGFDQFTIEQIAGDMLPKPTLDQLIATGFNRNHRGNSEGGIIPEEYAVEYVVDRVDTTATVWLGLTLGCARCHDHKFDPIKQKEFYGIYAYFNNVPESGRAVKEGNSPPFIKAPTIDQQAVFARLKANLKSAEHTFRKMCHERAQSQHEWEKTVDPKADYEWTVTNGLIAHLNLDGTVHNSAVTAKAETNQADIDKVDAGKVDDKADDETDTDQPVKVEGGEAKYVVGRTRKAIDLDGHRFINAGDIAKFGYFDQFSLAAWVQLKDEAGGTVISRMTKTARADGYSLQIVGGRVQVNLVKRWLDDSIRVESVSSLKPNRWYHVMMTYDGSRLASGIRIYIDGKPQALNVHLDGLNQSFANDEPLRIGAGDSNFVGLIDDVRVYDRCLANDEVLIVSVAESISELTGIRRPTTAQKTKLQSCFLHKHAELDLHDAYRNFKSLENQVEVYFKSIPTVMVMKEMNPPRDTFTLIRGQYDKPGEKVSRGIPAVFPALPKGADNNRLGFARWLVDAENPLTARVAVNRYWQIYFGAGLVRSVEDFGTQGTPPTHPRLLDWLATEFMRTGWDVKSIQRLIVTSATYRQSSRVRPDLLRRDPDNKLMARGPRFRLSAETIRDQALAAAGLLTEEIGGPPVRPYQPKGLWKEIATVQTYDQSHGKDLYRRSMYTYWKRTVTSPTMANFDASTREMCTVRESRTNTPIQALTLLNDVTFVEAARNLAERSILEGGTSPDQRLTFAFQLATTRKPKPVEKMVLLNGLRFHLDRYQKNPQAAAAFVALGESPRNERCESIELAAYTAVTSLILNLDEVLTKQ